MLLFIIILAFLVLFTFFLFIFSWCQFHFSLLIRIPLKLKTPGDFGMAFKSHELDVGNGNKITIWYIPVQHSKAEILLMHGYATTSGGSSAMLEQAQFLNKENFSTILIDPKSLAKSNRSKIYLGIREWQYAVKIYDYVKSLPENKDKKIGFLGESMGAVSSILANGITSKGDFVIASAPFYSYKSLFTQQIKRRGYPSFLVPIIIPFVLLSAKLELGFRLMSYSPKKVISSVKVPILIMSAERDNWVGSQAGKALFNIANFPKEFYHFPTSHAIFGNNPKEYMQKIYDFLNKYVTGTKP